MSSEEGEESIVDMSLDEDEVKVSVTAGWLHDVIMDGVEALMKSSDVFGDGATLLPGFADDRNMSRHDNNRLPAVKASADPDCFTGDINTLRVVLEVRNNDVIVSMLILILLFCPSIDTVSPPPY